MTSIVVVFVFFAHVTIDHLTGSMVFVCIMHIDCTQSIG